MAGQAVTFTEIEKMLEHFPAQPNLSCGGCDRVKLALEVACDHIEAWQVNDQNKVKLDRARVCLFAASHGVNANSTTETKRWLESSTQGTAIINQLCKLADAELRVYELDIENPTGDIRSEPAMNEEEAARAITYGMMAIEPGLDLVVLGSVGVGADLSAQAMKEALFSNNIQSKLSPLEVLRDFGGYDFCAMLGASIAARMAGIPVFIDSMEGQIIKSILNAMTPSGGDHLYVIEDDVFVAKTHRAVAALPSLKMHLVFDQDKTCQSKTGCGYAKAS